MGHQKNLKNTLLCYQEKPRKYVYHSERATSLGPQTYEFQQRTSTDFERKYSALINAASHEIGPKSAQITTTPDPINNGARNPISSTIDKVQHVCNHSHPGIGEDGYLCLNP